MSFQCQKGLLSFYSQDQRWTTRALWYPPAQSRRHLPNAYKAAPGRYRNQAVKIHSPEDSVVPLSSMRCSHPAARPADATVSTRLPVTSITQPSRGSAREDQTPEEWSAERDWDSCRALRTMPAMFARKHPASMRPEHEGSKERCSTTCETLVYTRSRVRIALDRLPAGQAVFLRFVPRCSGGTSSPAPVRWDAPRRNIGEAEKKQKTPTTATVAGRP